MSSTRKQTIDKIIQDLEKFRNPENSYAIDRNMEFLEKAEKI